MTTTDNNISATMSVDSRILPPTGQNENVAGIALRDEVDKDIADIIASPLTTKTTKKKQDEASTSYAKLFLESIRRKTVQAAPVKPVSLQEDVGMDKLDPETNDEIATEECLLNDSIAAKKASVCGVPVSPPMPPPVNLDRDGDVMTVASETMVVHDNNGYLSGSTLSFMVDDAISAMSEDLLNSMEEVTPEFVGEHGKIERKIVVDDAAAAAAAAAAATYFPFPESIEGNTGAKSPNIESDNTESVAGDHSPGVFMAVGDSLMRESLSGETQQQKEEGSNNIKSYLPIWSRFVFAFVVIAGLLLFSWKTIPVKAINIFGISFMPLKELPAEPLNSYFMENILKDAIATLGLLINNKVDVEYNGDVADDSQSIGLFNFSSSVDSIPPPSEAEPELATEGVSAEISASIDWMVSRSIGGSLHFPADELYEGIAALTAQAQDIRSGVVDHLQSCRDLPTLCQGSLALNAGILFLVFVIAIILQQRPSTDDESLGVNAVNIHGIKQENDKRESIDNVVHDEVLRTVDLRKYKLLRRDDLKSILQKRSCRASGNKGELIHRLVEDYHDELSALPYKALQGRLKRQGLKATGKKGVLMVRLLEAGFQIEE